MHCFGEDWVSCQRWMKAWPRMKFGFAADFGCPEVIKKLPMEKLLLETDAPYFPPMKMRVRLLVPLVEGGLQCFFVSENRYLYL